MNIRRMLEDVVRNAEATPMEKRSPDPMVTAGLLLRAMSPRSALHHLKIAERFLKEVVEAEERAEVGRAKTIGGARR